MQEKATELSTGGKTSSLLFGIQWDLVMKFIEEKGAKTQEELKTNSTDWGNHSTSTFEITRGLYTTAPGTSGSWNEANISNKYEKPTSTSTLLTTGASDQNSVLGIYDLAGNVWEWTLERYLNTNNPCCGRGGSYVNYSFSSPVTDHNGDRSFNDSNYGFGFRVVLW